MIKDNPVDNVLWIPIEQVQANDNNPNTVSKKEMDLLYTSIKHDGYTQPIVTIYDKKMKKYIIVDGFHRYTIAKCNPDILERNEGTVPVVVIDKDIKERMASTVRHNRARGKHTVNGMSDLVFSMLDKGMTDESICNELGMQPEELLRLKHITGFSKLFKDAEYNKSWKTKQMIEFEKEEELKGSAVPKGD